jgi:predicted esterase
MKQDKQVCLTNSIGKMKKEYSNFLILCIVHKLIEEEIKSGIKSERIIVGGFSQGGACALYITYQYNKPLGGCIVLSGYLPYHSKFHTVHNTFFDTSNSINNTIKEKRTRVTFVLIRFCSFVS